MTVSCDYDPARVYCVTTVKAAKVHKCCECHGVIRVGESHELVKGCWDGSWDSFRTCPDCVHLRCALTSAYGEGGCGWLHGGLHEELDNCRDQARTYGDEKAKQFIAMYNAVAPTRGIPPIVIGDT